MLKDELFVRSPRGMIPTPRSEQLSLPIRQALESLQHSVQPVRFDPSGATQVFRVAVDNYAAIVLVGLLASRVAKEAPKVTIEFRPCGTVDILDRFDSGDIDLALGPFISQIERVSRQSLLEDEFVAVLRKGHSAGTARKLSIEALATIPNLDISSVHYATDFIDEALRARKLARHITLRVPLHSAVSVLNASNMVSIFPRRLAEALVNHHPLIIRALGFSTPPIESAMIWPRRLDGHAGHLWLRGIVGDICKNLHSPRR